MDETTARLIADRGVWLSIQPFVGEGNSVTLTGESRAKQLQVIAGTETAYELAKKYHIKTAFGSDLLFWDRRNATGCDADAFEPLYAASEILKMATAANAELLSLAGPRNPYPGKLGVLEEGALADLILVDGNPLEKVQLIEDPATNFVIIMKDGKVHKNILHS